MNRAHHRVQTPPSQKHTAGRISTGGSSRVASHTTIQTKPFSTKSQQPYAQPLHSSSLGGRNTTTKSSSLVANHQRSRPFSSITTQKLRSPGDTESIIAYNTEKSAPKLPYLSSRLGESNYEFESLTALASDYSPLGTSSKAPAVDSLPPNLDALDLFDYAAKAQQAEIEQHIHTLKDEESRAFLLHQSSINFMNNIRIYRDLRKKEDELVMRQTVNAYNMLLRHTTELTFLNIITFLRASTLDRGALKIYCVDHLTDRHKFLVFQTCKDSTHLDQITSCLKRLALTKGVTQPETNYNEVAIFSPGAENSWEILDFGDVLLHLSYGEERALSGVESLLSHHEVDYDSPEGQFHQVIAGTRITQCFHISPGSDQDDELNISDSNGRTH